MTYGEFQYYKEEIKAWLRIVDFHSSELQTLLTQLNVIINFPIISLPDIKKVSTLTDRLTLHQQAFDQHHDQLEIQARRVRHAIVHADDTESSLAILQAGCRSQVMNSELAFLQTRNDCTVFLAAFFHPQLADAASMN